jgi:hypothetical protein
MQLLKTEPFPEFSKNLSKNRWADFLEILCLVNHDKEISLNDIITNFVQENLLEAIDGDETHSEKSVNLRLGFLEIFQYVASRQKFLNEYFPFENIDEDTIRVSEFDENKLLYIYLLFSSNTSLFIDKTIPPLLTTAFERISLSFMNILYPNFKNELFGTANQAGDFFHGGTLLEKLTKLSLCLNTTLTSKTINDPHNKSTGGDKGLDIVSFYDPDTETYKASYIPVCMGQCSCSYDDWKIKQFSISYDTWKNRLADLPHFHMYMFFPFSLRGINGTWADGEYPEAQAIIIDRFRLFSILKQNSIQTTEVLTGNIKSQIKRFLKELNVNVHDN